MGMQLDNVGKGGKDKPTSADQLYMEVKNAPVTKT